MSRPRTIRTSLMIGYVTVVLLITGLLMGMTFLGARTRAQEQSTRLMQRAMGQTKGSLEGFFGPVARSAGLVRDWAAEGVLDAEDPEALRRLVRPMLVQIRHLRWVEINDDAGRRLRIGRTEATWSIWRSAPGEEIVAWSWDDNVPLTEPLGAPGAAPLEAMAWKGRALGLELLAPSEGIVWEQAQDPASAWGSLAADAWYRTADDKGGMVALGVDVDCISDLTRNLRVTKEALAMVLIEAEGERVDGAPYEVIGLPGYPRFQNAEARLAMRGKAARHLGIRVVNDALRAAIARGRELHKPISFVSEDETWWLETDLFPLGNRTLLVVVLIPQHDLLVDRTALRWWLLGGAAAALILCLLLAAWLARRAERPIRELVEESERMRGGDFSEGEPIHTNVAELQQLAKAHDEMRVGLASLVKLERDLEVARQIQQATFPDHVPDVPGYAIAGSSMPADKTGGDSYDLIAVRKSDGDGSTNYEICRDDPDVLVCMLADATGHGVGPALSVAQLRSMVRMAVRVMPSPDRLARHLNEQLRADLPSSRFISAWLGRLDPKAHVLRGFSAGQGPIWHYRAADDTFEVYGSQMPPFGLFPDPKIDSDVATELAPGDLFVVLSDGFHEALGPDGEMFDEPRVQAVISAYAQQGPQAILAALTDAVDAFTQGAPPDDDRTAIILQRLG